MRGRKPKPTALHALQGTTNVTRHRERRTEPKAEGELQDEPPDWMTDSQKEAWRYAVANAPKGVLKAIDRAVLAVWVEAEDRHRIAAIGQRKLDEGNKLPLLLKGKDGQPAASPYLGIMTKAALVLMKAASELGFSPAARPRLTGGEAPQEDSPWAMLQVIDGGRAG